MDAGKLDHFLDRREQGVELDLPLLLKAPAWRPRPFTGCFSPPKVSALWNFSPYRVIGQPASKPFASAQHCGMMGRRPCLPRIMQRRAGSLVELHIKMKRVPAENAVPAGSLRRWLAGSPGASR
jgi:hypothetical protein